MIGLNVSILEKHHDETWNFYDQKKKSLNFSNLQNHSELQISKFIVLLLKSVHGKQN